MIVLSPWNLSVNLAEEQSQTLFYGVDWEITKMESLAVVIPGWFTEPLPLVDVTMRRFVAFGDKETLSNDQFVEPGATPEARVRMLVQTTFVIGPVRLEAAPER